MFIPLQMLVQAFKSTIIAVAGWAIGWISSTVYSLAFQLEGTTGAGTVHPRWYEQPAVVAGFVAGGFVVIGKLLDNYWYKKREEREEGESDADRLRELSEADRELTQAELKEFLERRNNLHEKEIRFLQGQILLKEVDIFKHREEKHRTLNELTRLHGHIRECHTSLASSGGTIPEFTWKYQPDIMEGVEEKVEEYRINLMKSQEH